MHVFLCYSFLCWEICMGRFFVYQEQKYAVSKKERTVINFSVTRRVSFQPVLLGGMSWQTAGRTEFRHQNFHSQELTIVDCFGFVINLPSAPEIILCPKFRSVIVGVELKVVLKYSDLWVGTWWRIQDTGSSVYCFGFVINLPSAPEIILCPKFRSLILGVELNWY